MITLNFKYIADANVVCAWGSYRDGANALRLLCANTGQPVATPSISLKGVKSDEYSILIRDYDENDGIMKCLIDNGVLQRNGSAVFGSTDAPIYKCTIADWFK